LSYLSQSRAKAVVNGRIIIRQFDRPAERGDRFLISSQCAEVFRQPAVKLSLIRANLQGAGDEIDRGLGLAALAVYHPQQMQGVWVVGFADQNLAIKLVRLIEPPGAMMLQAGGNRVGRGFVREFALRFQWKLRI
jgi:hypothetical protein